MLNISWMQDSNLLEGIDILGHTVFVSWGQYHFDWQIYDNMIMLSIWGSDPKKKTTHCVTKLMLETCDYNVVREIILSMVIDFKVNDPFCDIMVI